MWSSEAFCSLKVTVCLFSARGMPFEVVTAIGRLQKVDLPILDSIAHIGRLQNLKMDLFWDPLGGLGPEPGLTHHQSCLQAADWKGKGPSRVSAREKSLR